MPSLLRRQPVSRRATASSLISRRVRRLRQFQLFSDALPGLICRPAARQRLQQFQPVFQGGFPALSLSPAPLLSDFHCQPEITSVNRARFHFFFFPAPFTDFFFFRRLRFRLRLAFLFCSFPIISFIFTQFRYHHYWPGCH